MTQIRKLTVAGMAEAKAVIDDICLAMKDKQAPDRHREFGRRLYAALGDVHTDDWPELFGRGGVTGPSYLGTAYSGARLERFDSARLADVTGLKRVA
jgi:hypothetical protein